MEKQHIRLSNTDKTLCGSQFENSEYGLDVCSECSQIASRLLLPFTNRQKLLSHLQDQIDEEKLLDLSLKRI